MICGCFIFVSLFFIFFLKWEREKREKSEMKWEWMNGCNEMNKNSWDAYVQNCRTYKRVLRERRARETTHTDPTPKHGGTSGKKLDWTNDQSIKLTDVGQIPERFGLNPVSKCRSQTDEQDGTRLTWDMAQSSRAGGSMVWQSDRAILKRDYLDCEYCRFVKYCTFQVVGDFLR